MLQGFEGNPLSQDSLYFLIIFPLILLYSMSNYPIFLLHLMNNGDLYGENGEIFMGFIFSDSFSCKTMHYSDFTMVKKVKCGQLNYSKV